MLHSPMFPYSPYGTHGDLAVEIGFNLFHVIYRSQQIFGKQGSSNKLLGTPFGEHEDVIHDHQKSVIDMLPTKLQVLALYQSQGDATAMPLLTRR